MVSALLFAAPLYNYLYLMKCVAVFLLSIPFLLIHQMSWGNSKVASLHPSWVQCHRYFWRLHDPARYNCNLDKSADAEEV